MAEFVIPGVGGVIRRHRLALDLSLAELAERAGTDKSQLAKYETDKVGITDAKLMILAKALRIPAEALAHECLLAIKPHLRSKPIGRMLGQLSAPASASFARAVVKNSSGVSAFLNVTRRAISAGAGVSVRIDGTPKRIEESPTVSFFPANGSARRMESSASRTRRLEYAVSCKRPSAVPMPVIGPNRSGDASA
jgi:transcriptional regulator with XRE-family HTH domain